MDKKKHIHLKKIAQQVRREVLEVISMAHASHIGSAYSVVDLLVYLYEEVIHKDKMILSKGWAVSALYSVLAHNKIIDYSFMKRYCADGSPYIGIATKDTVPGIEATTGSMGHGLPVAVGIALAAKMKHQKHRVFVIIGDGELNEGSTWEGILQGSHFKLDNLVIIVDVNGWQSYGRTRDVLNTEPLVDKFQSFGWTAKEINGHDFLQMEKVFRRIPLTGGHPSVVIARTVKGKGVSIFEDSNDWHYRTPGPNEITKAVKELNTPI